MNFVVLSDLNQAQKEEIQMKIELNLLIYMEIDISYLHVQYTQDIETFRPQYV